jgi:hypothetical protein
MFCAESYQCYHHNTKHVTYGDELGGGVGFKSLSKRIKDGKSKYLSVLGFQEDEKRSGTVRVCS